MSGYKATDHPPSAFSLGKLTYQGKVCVCMSVCMGVGGRTALTLCSQTCKEKRRGTLLLMTILCYQVPARQGEYRRKLVHIHRVGERGYLPPLTPIKKIVFCHPNCLISSLLTFEKNSYELVLRREKERRHHEPPTSGAPSLKGEIQACLGESDGGIPGTEAGAQRAEKSRELRRSGRKPGQEQNKPGGVRSGRLPRGPSVPTPPPRLWNLGGQG